MSPSAGDNYNSKSNLTLSKWHQLMTAVHTATLCTILSTAPREDFSAVGQHHHVVVAAWHLTDRALIEKLQKNWLQNLTSQRVFHADAAVIVRPKHVHLVFVCWTSRDREENHVTFVTLLSQDTHRWHRQWSQTHTPPVEWPSPEASPLSLAAGTTPGHRVPAGPPSWLHSGHSADRDEEAYAAWSTWSGVLLNHWWSVTHSPRVQLLFHRHHCKVTFSRTHMLGAGASFKRVQFLGGEFASTPEVHIPGPCGHHGNRGLRRCTQSVAWPEQKKQKQKNSRQNSKKTAVIFQSRRLWTTLSFKLTWVSSWRNSAEQHAPPVPWDRRTTCVFWLCNNSSFTIWIILMVAEAALAKPSSHGVRLGYRTPQVHQKAIN